MAKCKGGEVEGKRKKGKKGSQIVNSKVKLQIRECKI
jgi:hypothetical protein